MKTLTVKSKLLLTVLPMSIVLSGCSTYGRYDDFKRETEINKEAISNTLESNKYQKVLVLDKPPRVIKEIRKDNRPQWFDDETKVVANGLPLSLAIKQIVGDSTPIRYGYAVDPNTPINNFFFEGKKEEALNILSLTSSYGITATKQGVKVDKFMTKTYTLPTVRGNESIQMGSTGESAGSAENASAGDVTSTGGGDGQFSKLSVESSNLTEQIYNGISKILTGEGNITTSATAETKMEGGGNAAREKVLGYVEKMEGLSAVVVRTSPAMMQLVDDYVNFTINEMTKQVELEITVLEYQQTEGTEFGVDLALSRITGSDSTAITLGTSIPALSDSIDGVGIGAKVGTGIWSGTTALINALRTTGDVSVGTQETVKATNHRVQEVDLGTVQAYFESVEVTYDDNNDPTTDIQVGYVRDGVKMMALANVQDDEVYLKLTGTLSKVLALDNETVNEITVSKPTTRQARFNVTGSYEYNKPFIVTHLKQTIHEANKNRYADIEVGNNANKQVIDTLVVVTPRLVSKPKSAFKTL